MKRILFFLLSIVCLSACTKNDGLDKAMTLRDKMLKSSGCNFQAVVTADYGDNIYSFTMNCHSDKQGTVTFTVMEPESIRDISGTISAEGGKLTFDEQVLAFPLMADGQVSPVSAPWLFVKTLMSGYITACGTDGDIMKIMINDSYEENALQLEIWTDQNSVPKRCEILWKGSRVLTVAINDFVIL